MSTGVNAASSLYRELSKAELSAAVSSALRTRLISNALLNGGLFNTTYLLDTQDCGKVVLRAGPVNRHLLIPFEHRMMAAEAQVYELLAAHGVPASEVLAMDLSRSVLDRDLMFVRYLPSRAMSQCVLSAPDRARICREIGAATAKMHSIPSVRFGRVANGMDGIGYDRWSGCLYGELLDWERVGVPSGLFTAGEHGEIRRLFREAAPCLDEITEPRLVHTDLWLGNILVRTDAERPEFGAIIDADRAFWGDPMYEFSSIRWAYGEPTFWEGYGEAPAQDRNARLRRAVYTLLDRLLNAYVYLKEYNDADSARSERASAFENMALLRTLLA